MSLFNSLNGDYHIQPFLVIVNVGGRYVIPSFPIYATDPISVEEIIKSMKSEISDAYSYPIVWFYPGTDVNKCINEFIKTLE